MEISRVGYSLLLMDVLEMPLNVFFLNVIPYQKLSRVDAAVAFSGSTYCVPGRRSCIRIRAIYHL